MYESFHIGDRVIALSSIAGFSILKGRTGTIISKNELYPIGIEFDEAFPDGHSCAGKGKNGHCRWIFKGDNIELIATESDFEESEELNKFLEDITVV